MRDAARPVPIVRPFRYCSLVCLNFVENKRSALCLSGLDGGIGARWDSGGTGACIAGRAEGARRDSGVMADALSIPAQGERCGRQVQLRPERHSLVPNGGRRACERGVSLGENRSEANPLCFVSAE